MCEAQHTRRLVNKIKMQKHNKFRTHAADAKPEQPLYPSLMFRLSTAPKVHRITSRNIVCFNRTNI